MAQDTLFVVGVVVKREYTRGSAGVQQNGRRGGSTVGSGAPYAVARALPTHVEDNKANKLSEHAIY